MNEQQNDTRIDELKKRIEELRNEEARLVFPHFSQASALELGLAIHEEAVKRKAALTIDIRRGDHILFHYSMEGTGPNNERWVLRKSNTVQLLQASSYRVGQENLLKGSTLTERHALPFADYADHGGSFPLTVEGAGTIGAITVSGLPQEEDHALLVAVLERFIEDLKQPRPH